MASQTETKHTDFALPVREGHHPPRADVRASAWEGGDCTISLRSPDSLSGAVRGWGGAASVPKGRRGLRIAAAGCAADPVNPRGEEGHPSTRRHEKPGTVRLVRVSPANRRWGSLAQISRKLPP